MAHGVTDERSHAMLFVPTCGGQGDGGQRDSAPPPAAPHLAPAGPDGNSASEEAGRGDKHPPPTPQCAASPISASVSPPGRGGYGVGGGSVAGGGPDERSWGRGHGVIYTGRGREGFSPPSERNNNSGSKRAENHRTGNPNGTNADASGKCSAPGGLPFTSAKNKAASLRADGAAITPCLRPIFFHGTRLPAGGFGPFWGGFEAGGGVRVEVGVVGVLPSLGHAGVGGIWGGQRGPKRGVVGGRGVKGVCGWNEAKPHPAAVWDPGGGRWELSVVGEWGVRTEPPPELPTPWSCPPLCLGFPTRSRSAPHAWGWGGCGAGGAPPKNTHTSLGGYRGRRVAARPVSHPCPHPTPADPAERTCTPPAPPTIAMGNDGQEKKKRSMGCRWGGG